MKKCTIILCMLLYWITDASASSAITTMKISDDSYVMSAVDYGTNIGVISTEKGVVVIDPMPGKALLPALAKQINDLTQSQVRFVLNTHNHEDHTGGNEFFLGEGAQQLNSPDTITEIDSFLVNSHTPKDQVFFLPQENVVFTGDVFDTSWHPTFYSGGIKGFDDAIDKILALGDEQTLIVPGHGQPADKAALRKFRKNTHDWVARVKVLHQQGLSISEMKQHPDIQSILQRFNVEQRAEFIPDRAFQRFLERTVTLIETH